MEKDFKLEAAKRMVSEWLEREEVKLWEEARLRALEKICDQHAEDEQTGVWLPVSRRWSWGGNFVDDGEDQ